MFNKTFYHSLTRKYVSCFGNLFNDIYIRRVNSDNTRIQTIPVPIRYSPKSRWMEQLASNPQDQKYAIHLPFIAFQISSLQYDGSRAMSPLNRSSKISNDRTKMQSVFQLVPYKIAFEMTLVAKHQDDLCQIYEQIFPYFTPDHVNTITLIPELDLERDITFTLTGAAQEDTFEGDFKGDSRSLKMTLNFEADIWFAGPISKAGIIKRIQVDFMANINKESRDERVVITPGLTIDGKPTTIYEESIPYLEIEPEDDYGFVEQDFTFLDNKVYNPITGLDE
jgi:hypothetical protein